MKEIPLNWELVKTTDKFKLYRDENGRLWQRCRSKDCSFTARASDDSNNLSNGLKLHIIRSGEG